MNFLIQNINSNYKYVIEKNNTKKSKLVFEFFNSKEKEMSFNIYIYDSIESLVKGLKERGFEDAPDYSLLSELCKILEISINELFLGEKISNENYKEKAEENMNKLIKENYSKELLLKRTLKGFITGIVVFIIVYITMNI